MNSTTLPATPGALTNRALAARIWRVYLARRWKEYKIERARKKFKVYMKKHGSDGNPWVN